jgi:SAM-dependent methyltransferase
MSRSVNRDQTSETAWKEAQQWEEAHWVRTQKLRARFGKNYIWRVLRRLGLVEYYRGNDYNDWWADKFNRFEFVPATIENAIEVGCGPYTNIRLILDRHPAKHLVLSDPLIRTYVKFKLTFVAAMYARAQCVLDDHPLEELPYRDNYFDLTVMINVLDHVRDAGECVQNVIRVTKPGGIVIIGQDLTNEQDLEALKNDPGAVGHPIKLDAEWFDPYLGSGFEPILDKVLSREEGRDPQHHYGTLLFAGRKRA